MNRKKTLTIEIASIVAIVAIIAIVAIKAQTAPKFDKCFTFNSGGRTSVILEGKKFKILLEGSEIPSDGTLKKCKRISKDEAMKIFF